MKKWLQSLFLVLAMSLVFSSTGLAKSEVAKKSLVALGDSIPFGYNLGVNNDHPSKLAYPYIMGNQADLRVRDLAEPGWTTDQLLTALRSDEKFRQAVGHADYITMSIGNNDLLGALRRGGGDPVAVQMQLAQTLPTLLDNLDKTVAAIRGLTDAPIVIYNIYNPFQLTDQPLNSLSAYLLNNPDPRQMDVNDLYAMHTAILNMSYGNVHLADAYSAFGNSGQYVRVGDIHPTTDGQAILAEVGLDAFGLE
jgi:lysophospholipase L1-like esterase